MIAILLIVALIFALLSFFPLRAPIPCLSIAVVLVIIALLCWGAPMPVLARWPFR